ncbi:MAG: hypothetical protein K2K16_06210 [Ruminococcus sp.]|nr:hypothetical protein [Ruminococcus sp.]
MAYYLIDYENVHVSGMDGFSNLTADDKIVIFYSDNSNSLTFEIHQQLMDALCKVEYHKAETGSKNALDFQLSSYLGYLIRASKKKSDNRFFIVSRDNGFSVLCTYWKNKNISVEMVVNLNGDKNAESPEKTEFIIENFNEIEKVVSLVVSEKPEIDLVVSAVRESNTRTELSRKLVSYFRDGTKVHEIFTALKPFIKNMPGQ